jgi:hypothetical protein
MQAPSTRSARPRKLRKVLIYGRREPEFVEGKEAKFDVGLNCTTLQYDVTLDCVDGEISSILALFDHFIRPRQHIRRDSQVDLLGCFQVMRNSNFCGKLRFFNRR